MRQKAWESQRLRSAPAGLARKLKVTQAAISQLERRPNLLLESVANYIQALGGRLELLAVRPHRTV